MLIIVIIIIPKHIHFSLDLVLAVFKVLKTTLLGIPYSRLFSCGFNFRTACAGRKLDFEKFFLPI